ncbi:MAG: iron ABC transporter permease [Lachnospiraceae bacterium]|nr:iron ABC transporter permease [Lachnospiraceae bacterium]
MENKKKEEIQSQYRKKKRQKYLVILGSVLLLLFLSIFFTTLGAADTSIGDILKAIVHGITLGSGNVSQKDKIILLLRLPRVAMAVCGGFGLAIAGTAMQAVTRNPLVSPFTIGVSNAAAFGASLTIVFGIGLFSSTQFGIVLNAFLWAIGCMMLVYLISSKVGLNPSSIVLTGIALNYFFSACTSTIEFFASEHKLAAVVQWAFGSVNGSEWKEVWTVFFVVTICAVQLFLYTPSMNIISTGDDEVAQSLGIQPERVRIRVCILAVLATASVISFTGVIGFVGLAGPHIARMIIGSDHRYLFLFSGVIGSLLMLIADTIGRLILAPVIVPVGIVISFLGVPIFINLILSQKRGRI